MPVHNSECWLDECLKSVLEQDFKGTMELSIFNDASKVRFKPLKYCPSKFCLVQKFLVCFTIQKKIAASESLFFSRMVQLK